MKDRNPYMPPLKTMTCIVLVDFTQGIPLPCDLAMICPEAQTGGFSLQMRAGPATLSLLGVADGAACVCGL